MMMISNTSHNNNHTSHAALQLQELSHCYVAIAVLCCCYCTILSKLHKEVSLNAPAALCIVTLNNNDNECSNTSSAFSYDLDLHQIIQTHRSQHTFLFHSDHCITICWSPVFLHAHTVSQHFKYQAHSLSSPQTPPRGTWVFGWQPDTAGWSLALWCHSPSEKAAPPLSCSPSELQGKDTDKARCQFCMYMYIHFGNHSTCQAHFRM